MAVELLTYNDCVQHLLDVFQLNDAGKMGRRARIAVDSVYRDVPYRINWRYYQRRATFRTVASYSTGTIEFDLTGGSSERLVTLTTGTFPSWTQYGRITIDDVSYRVATNPSTTTLTLYEDDCPSADIAAGETYTLYRNSYPLPAGFRRAIKLFDVEDEQEIPMVGFGQSHRAGMSVYDTPDEPVVAYMRNTGDYYGVWSVEFWPPPSTVLTYDLSYEAKPRDINTVSYSTGTVSTSSTTVTGDTTVFPAGCAGSIIRFGTSASATAVTNKFGANPFTEQRVIASRTSDTALVVDAAPTSAYSAGTAYQISDPIDIHPGGMTTAFLRGIEAEFARVSAMKDAAERMMIFERALGLAMENEPTDTFAHSGYAYQAYPSWTTEA